MFRILSNIFKMPPLALLALCTLTWSAQAHPHVWVTVETNIIHNQSKAISAFRHKWTFDEYYSSFAIQGLDKNRDGKYDKAELAELAEVNVSTLKEFGFFTFPKINGKMLERERPIDYYLEYDGTLLTLHLTVPLKDVIPSENTSQFTLGVYDPTFYVDFALAKDNPIRLSNAPSGCKPAIKAPDPKVTGQGGVSALGEAFFNSVDANSDIAAQYAKTITINCAAS